MLRNKRVRRRLAAALVLLGGVLMVFAPEIWAGLLVLALGVLLEIAGITLERRT